MNRILGLTGVGVICFGAANIAKADESVKFRIVMHATSNQTQDVGDVDGHTMSLSHFSGLALFPDGSVGTANFTFTGDYIRGTGTFLTYFKVTLKDGSTLWWKGTGEGKPNGTGNHFS
jgi:hypothetical protein